MTPETRAEIERAAKEYAQDNLLNYTKSYKQGFEDGYILGAESFAADREKLIEALAKAINEAKIARTGLYVTGKLSLEQIESDTITELQHLLNTLKK